MKTTLKHTQHSPAEPIPVASIRAQLGKIHAIARFALLGSISRVPLDSQQTNESSANASPKRRQDDYKL